MKTDYLSRPIPYVNRMATDVVLPEEAAYVAMIARDLTPHNDSESMDDYCRKVQRQLEEDKGKRREFVY